MVSLNTWRKLQAASGLVFAVFQSIHFLSHFSTLRGWDSGLAALTRARTIYHIPLFEVILFAALGLHLVSNGAVYFKRAALEKHGPSKKDDDHGTKGGTATTAGSPPGSLELKAHRYAGYILSAFIFGHVFATRGVALFILDKPHDYDYSVLTAVSDDIPYAFTLYLIIFGMAGNWHLVYGVRSALSTLTGHSVHFTPFPIPLKVVALTLHVLLIGSVLVVSGYWYAIDRTKGAEIYQMMHSKFHLS